MIHAKFIWNWEECENLIINAHLVLLSGELNNSITGINTVHSKIKHMYYQILIFHCLEAFSKGHNFQICLSDLELNLHRKYKALTY